MSTSNDTSVQFSTLVMPRTFVAHCIRALVPVDIFDMCKNTSCVCFAYVLVLGAVAVVHRASYLGFANVRGFANI